MSISQTIADFVTVAIENGGYMEMDRLYLQNKVLGLIGETTFEPSQPKGAGVEVAPLITALLNQAIENKVVGKTASAQDVLVAQLTDLMTPPPSVVNALFAEHYHHSPEDATNYFFDLSQKNDYIKTAAIAKNIIFPAKTEYGDLEITINLSKPEKDPKEIAAAKTAPAHVYPKCLLCMENEGYLGGGAANYPARTNHRLIRLNLQGESWGFQYSPYAYYNEHCIILAEEHRPMKINEDTFRRLLEIVQVFPHYFVGSNADLPIVGGSILSHDHYQGGHHEFPMQKAAAEKSYTLTEFPDVSLEKVRWPMSVLRLRSENKDHLIQVASHILTKWKNYSDPSVDVRAYSGDGTRHHTVTPIARKVGKNFEMDIVLRDNNISAEFPDGIFHPHPDVQHIKKENIGLIEVLGLAILPPRLKDELAEVEKYLLSEKNQIAAIHVPWAEEISKKYATITSENVEKIVQAEVGAVFCRVLEDAGVFKRDEQGEAAFEKFIATL
ncbi:UDP-glucose--hexose-1-phosphate uridylyltransferase [Enterococcus timonensis]|uniref:UDP-glucose--hexose-1-phosphate uridylyltransferase n=1 Tax=Enterococcus timonensis TaxID=1852364 RepID=UPI0008DA6E15|nr:UDP-glucose--hexose-1-phosphate uridylyltransferase [Enterococcus timonensis]